MKIKQLVLGLIISSSFFGLLAEDQSSKKDLINQLQTAHTEFLEITNKLAKAVLVSKNLQEISKLFPQDISISELNALIQQIEALIEKLKPEFSNKKQIVKNLEAEMNKRGIHFMYKGHIVFSM